MYGIASFNQSVETTWHSFHLRLVPWPRSDLFSRERFHSSEEKIRAIVSAGMSSLGHSLRRHRMGIVASRSNPFSLLGPRPSLFDQPAFPFSSHTENLSLLSDRFECCLTRHSSVLSHSSVAEYCSQMAKPSLEKSLYLQTIGNGLDENIEIFWTGKFSCASFERWRDRDESFVGPRVISRRLTSSHLSVVNNLLRRPVTIWDNLNANDYDQRRLCLGPLAGRSSTLSSHLSGLLSNPNCEFELNFIPLNTLGQWFQSIQIHSNREQIDDDEENDDPSTDPLKSIYQPEQALSHAIHQWLTEFHKMKSPVDWLFPPKVLLSLSLVSPSNRNRVDAFRSNIRRKR